MSVQPTSQPIPLYRRIHDDLLTKIEAGAFHAGDRLPSEAELAREYNVSRITSRQALDLLCSEGLLIRRQGMGSFVTAPKVSQPLVRLTDFVEDMAQAGLKAESRVLHFGEEKAGPDIAAQLDLAASSRVFRLDRLRLADSSPIALDRTWLPPQFGKLLAGEDLENRTIYEILEKDYGIQIASGTYTIEAYNAVAEQAQLLQIEERAALLVFLRTSSAADGRVVYLQQRFYRADRVQYSLKVTRTAPGHNAIESFVPVFSHIGTAAG